MKVRPPAPSIVTDARPPKTPHVVADPLAYVSKKRPSRPARIAGAPAAPSLALSGPRAVLREIQARSGLVPVLQAQLPTEEGQENLYRADNRHPKRDGIFQQGFRARGTNLDLYEHVHGKPDLRTGETVFPTDTAFVSTTSNPSKVEEFGVAEPGRPAWIYKIDVQLPKAPMLPVNVNHSHDARGGGLQTGLYRSEDEVAVVGRVPGQAIKGAWPMSFSGAIGPFFPNPFFAGEQDGEERPGEVE